MDDRDAARVCIKCGCPLEVDTEKKVLYTSALVGPDPVTSGVIPYKACPACGTIGMCRPSDFRGPRR